MEGGGREVLLPASGEGGEPLAGGLDAVFRARCLCRSEQLGASGEARARLARSRRRGQFDGKLSNGGETLEVRLPDPSKVAIQRFQYNDNWYGSTDGRGHSLTVLDARVDVKRWGDISNWRPSPEEGGSPGK